MTTESTTASAAERFMLPGAGPGPHQPDDGTPFVAGPQSVAETGLQAESLIDLLAKFILTGQKPTGLTLSDRLKLPFPVVQEVLTIMRSDKLLEVTGSTGLGDQMYTYALTERGNQRATTALQRSQYIGPAPVPLTLYSDVQGRQSARAVSVRAEDVAKSLSHVVISGDTVRAIGAAVVSGKAMLIYGSPGNGKSVIASALRGMLPGHVLIPYAIDIDGHIVKLFDERTHERAAVDAAHELRRDRRFVVCKRPLVTVAGELTLDDLELRLGANTGIYAAPPPLRANGGVLVVDDLGRQMVRPDELLNRWIMPMQTGIDQLSLTSGEHVQVPFDVILVFTTNLEPSDLGDEAFHRRIRHKVRIPNPTREEFTEILRRSCDHAGVPFRQDALDHLIREFYEREDRDFRGCHPSDLVETIVDLARYEGTPPQLTERTLAAACASYFVHDETDMPGAPSAARRAAHQ